MSYCPQCGSEVSSDARFCRACGAAVSQSSAAPERQREVRRYSASADWLSLDDVIYTRDRRFGAIGALLVFFGAFLPWARTEFSFFGMTVGSYGSSSPQAWLVALAGIAAGVFLFRQRFGTIVMVIGIVVAAWTLLFALMTLSGQASPSWGVLLTLAGGSLLGYSGHLTNRYER